MMDIARRVVLYMALIVIRNQLASTIVCCIIYEILASSMAVVRMRWK